MLTHWNWLDWTMAILVLLSTLSGVREGFVRGLIGLATLVVGLAVAATGYASLGSRLSSSIHSASLANGAAFLILFIAVLLLGSLLTAVSQKLIKTVGLRWLDRFVGLFFGFVRGVIVDAVLIMAMLAFAIKVEAVQSSRLAPSVTSFSKATAALMPPELRSRFSAGLDDLKQALKRAGEQTGGGHTQPVRSRGGH